MDHLGTKRLETERLILRPFVPEDEAPMFRNWASDPVVTRYLTWPAHQSPDVTRMVIDKWVESYAQPNYYQWAIELKAIGEPIGSISGVKTDEAIRTVEVGYCIGRPWWGQGLVAEAVRAFMAFFFDEVGMDRVVACHHPDNPNSGRVMLKCGMTFEGKWAKEGQDVDLCWYGIGREQYYQEKMGM